MCTSPWLVRLAALVFIVASVPASALTINRDAPPVAVPDLALEDGQGNLLGLDAFAGRVVVLNLWATWCPPCVRELPTLAALQAAFDPADVVVVALAVERAEFVTLRAFLDELGADNLHLLRNPDMAAARALGAQGLPVTLVIDRDGRERFRHAGYADWSTDAVVAALRALVSE